MRAIVGRSIPCHSVVAGTTLTYTLAYTNNGSSDAQNIVITDTLPDSVTYGGVVDQPLGWSDPLAYTPGSPATLTWHTPTLAADTFGTIVFTVTVDTGAGAQNYGGAVTLGAGTTLTGANII